MDAETQKRLAEIPVAERRRLIRAAVDSWAKGRGGSDTSISGPEMLAAVVNLWGDEPDEKEEDTAAR